MYDAKALRGLDDDETVTLETEIARALRTGPGIVVFTGAFEVGVVDRTTTAFEAMIATQRASGATSGDHFAKPGANDRVWNALEKLAVAAPDAFVEYYANDVVALVAEAGSDRLPGDLAGQRGEPRRRGADRAPRLPPGFPVATNGAVSSRAHVHELSQVLTLQGAVAHGDMPLVSGSDAVPAAQPEVLARLRGLPPPGVQEFFESHYVQLPLAKGDAVFFNPALLHAAGSNHSVDIRRMANLLQISSAFGRAMETVDRERVVTAIYPSLLAAAESGMSAAQVENVVAAGAEGYPFPTNLDRAQPVDGMAPPSQAELLARAVANRAGVQDLADSLAAQARSQLSQ